MKRISIALLVAMGISSSLAAMETRGSKRARTAVPAAAEVAAEEAVKAIKCLLPRINRAFAAKKLYEIQAIMSYRLGKNVLNEIDACASREELKAFAELIPQKMAAMVNDLPAEDAAIYQSVLGREFLGRYVESQLKVLHDYLHGLEEAAALLPPNPTVEAVKQLLKNQIAGLVKNLSKAYTEALLLDEATVQEIDAKIQESAGAAAAAE